MKKKYYLFLIFVINIIFVNNVKADDGLINYSSHVQNIGWQQEFKDGETSGTSGKSLRLESMKIRLSGNLNGDVEYQTHVQNIGWQSWKKNGEISGTTGMSLRLEGIKLKLVGQVASDYDIYYRTHVQNIGWQKWVKNGELAGTTGKSLRLEAIEIKLVLKISIPVIESSGHVDNSWQNYVTDDYIGTVGKSKGLDAFKIKLTLPDSMTGNIEYSSYITPNGWLGNINNDEISGSFGKNIEAIKIRLTGKVAEQYDIYYQVHVSNIGWMGWTSNGNVAGTKGYFNRVEAIRIKLLLKNSAELSVQSNAYLEAINSVKYQSHVQNIGWQTPVSDGAISGTSGANARLESFKVKLNSKLSGNISYSSYVAKVGWQPYVNNGAISGTVGLGRNLEAIKIKLDGNISNYYDIYYQVHVSNIGWLGWTKNNAKAGSVGNLNKIEAIQIRLVKKGLPAPGSTNNSYVTGTWKNNTYYTFFNQQLKGFQFIDGVKYYFDERYGNLIGRNVKKVIDVSSYQGNINWNKIKSDGDIDEVILRVGWGMSYDDAPGVDSKFSEYIKGVQSNNIPYSLYIYSYAKVDRAAIKEADFVKKMMDDYGIPKSTFVWYDVERGYARSIYEKVVPTFIERLNAYGIKSGVYGNISALDTGGGYLNSSKIRNYPIWVAQYYYKPQYSGNYKGWQYTSVGSVNGISGNVDVNMFY